MLSAGDIDVTFGNGGIATLGGTVYHASALQPDGKIVTAGIVWASEYQAGLARYNPEGSLDETFGIDGRTIANLVPSASQYIEDIAIQSDGKILIVGTAEGRGVVNSLVLARFDAHGSLDATFGTQGVATIAVPEGIIGKAVAIQNDGKILVAGARRHVVPGPYWDLAPTVWRFDANGTLDTTFGSGGSVSIFLGIEGLGWASAGFSGLAIQEDGKIVTVGRSAFPYPQVAVARFTVDGVLDATFNGSGVVLDDIGGGSNYGYVGVVIQPDGHIVTAANVWSQDTGNRIAVVRFNPDGSKDAAFNGTGVQTLFAETSIGVSDVDVDQEGRIIVAGAQHTGEFNAFLAGRLLPDGSLDPDFGINGLAVARQAGFPGVDEGGTVLIPPYGGILVDGNVGYPNYFGITRFVAPVSVDMEVTQFVHGEPSVGETVQFILTVTNHGPGDVLNAQILDQLPPGLSFVSASASFGSYDPLTGIWNAGYLSGIAENSFGLSSSATLIITATVDDDSSAGQTLTNVATILGNILFVDRDPSNDAAAATIVVKAPPSPPETSDGPDAILDQSGSIDFGMGEQETGSIDPGMGEQAAGSQESTSSATPDLLVPMGAFSGLPGESPDPGGGHTDSGTGLPEADATQAAPAVPEAPAMPDAPVMPDAPPTQGEPMPEGVSLFFEREPLGASGSMVLTTTGFDGQNFSAGDNGPSATWLQSLALAVGLAGLVIGSVQERRNLRSGPQARL